MSEFDFGTLAPPKLVKREIKAVAVKPPDSVIAMAQAAWDAQSYGVMDLPDQEVTELFISYMRSAGEYTEPKTTVLAYRVNAKGERFDPEKEKGKPKPKRVKYMPTERRGRKVADKANESNGSEDGSESQTEGNGDE